METQPKSQSNKKIFKGFLLTASAMMLAAFVLPKDFYTPVNENAFTKDLKQKTEVFTKHTADERIYLQCDRPMYEPGDNIWFAAYLLETQSLKASKTSDIVHVELIDPKGSVAKTISLISHSGKAAGDFSLDADMPGGMYKLRAHTNWMKNRGEKNVFEKEFQVQKVVLPNLKMKLEYEKKGFGPGDEVIAKLALNTNENQPLSNYQFKFVCDLDGKKFLDKSDATNGEGTKIIRFKLPENLNTSDGLLNVMISYNGNTESVSRSIPILLNKVDIAMFPEGGNLVSGLESTVAFRATNEYGKPADIDGVVVTEKGSQVATFSSFHQGMGAFKITPQKNEKYFLKITRPVGIEKKYEMPTAFEKGYVMNVDASRDGEVTASVFTTQNEELSIVAQIRGQIYYTNTIKATKGSNKIIFPTENFPAGVMQITLFDSLGIPQSERLAFVNHDRKLSIAIETEKEKYLPREKVKMHISVKDNQGNPVAANLSMSVVNDQFLSFANSKEGNILSQLFFQQDLKEKIEDPAFYFDDKEPKAKKALDYLLMTAGWRQFTWEKVQKQQLPYYSYQPEKTIIAGTIFDQYNYKPIANASIKSSSGHITKTDSNGKFIMKHFDLYEPITLNISGKNYTNQQYQIASYNQNLTFYLYNPENYKTHTTYWNKRAKGMPAMARNVNEDAMVNEIPAQAEMNFAGAVQQMNNVQQLAIGNANGAGHFAANNMGDMIVKEMDKVDEERKKGENVMMDSIAVAKDFRFKQKNEEKQIVMNGAAYYRARKFAAPVYNKEEKVEVRTDFRNTVYWNPEIKIASSGEKTIEFYASDDITSLRTIVEGIGKGGNIGRAEKTLFTQLPFQMTVKIPVEVATEDIVSIPLNLKNNTDGPLGGELKIIAPDGLIEVTKIPNVQTVMPGKAKTIYLDYKVSDKTGTGDFTVSFKACGLSDAFTQKIKIAPKGFPVTASFSSQEKEKEYSFSIAHLVKGSIKATVTAYPNVVSDLMKGVEGILREPYGCFEQTSMSSYPNTMVLDYLKSTGSNDEATMAKATSLLDRGYKKLATYETKEKGYEWFGSNPGHEALTAYGLMQFIHMKKVGGNVDDNMIKRTTQWLMDRKNGNGGFKRSAQALDQFGRASEQVTNAYIVYALSEAGYTDIKKEFNASYEDAKKGDTYVMALVANAAYNLNEKSKGDNLLAAIIKKQNAEGAFNGADHSITYSQGQSLTIETTSLAIMAILKSEGKNYEELSKGIKFLVGTRNGYGTFGNTQGTVLALKALTEYAKYSKQIRDDGTILIYVNGKKAGEHAYKAGQKEAIVIDGLEKFIDGEGNHDIEVKFANTKSALPYSVAVSWNTSLPNSQKECVVDLKTKLFTTTANVGETVRLNAKVTNKKNEGIPSTMVILGIPAGFTVQPWQLKELQDKKVFDYYEISGNNVAIYYRCMAPSAVKEINLDLKAEMPGEYDAPASAAYLYYTNEFKTWNAVERITIKKNNS